AKTVNISVPSIVSDHMLFADGKILKMGNAADLQLKHDGTNSLIENIVGNLHIRQSTDDGDMKFECDDGSGGTTEYFRLDGGDEQVKVFKNLTLDDNIQTWFGDSNDLRIYHNGSHSYILNTTGDLVFNQSTDDGNILFYCDDGSGGVETYLSLDGGLGYTTAQKAIRFNDSVKAAFGSGLDLQLYHNGSHSYIENNVGNIAITNNTDDGDIIFSSDDGSGGTTAYLTLDGGDTKIIASKPLEIVGDSGYSSDLTHLEISGTKTSGTSVTNVK
ncbi:MAG: hypothetical protein GY919_04230, partial [Photobacterium aquimaris]|nr:hypothetical protein [Photobacterium aquimaris]